MRSRPVVLVGAGGLAREALTVAREGEPVDLVAIDDDEALWGTTIGGVSVIGGLHAVRDLPRHAVVVCAGVGETRRRLVARLGDLGVDPERYLSLVHPSIWVPPTCRIGRGSIVLEGVVLTADVTVGEHVVLMSHATLTHDDFVEDYATLCAGVSLGGRVLVGSGAYLGMNSCVREGTTVGAGTVLGMGAVLLEDTPDGGVWVGVPARHQVRQVVQR